MVVAEPHHADLMLLEAPSRSGAMLTVERRDDLPEYTTVTRGVVVIALVVEVWDIMKLQRKEQHKA